jgi:serine/threonine protein phosphatase 1
MIEFQQAPAALPDGVRIYAVGDVHGCVDRLDRLHRRIATDLAKRPAEEPLLVHLGDLVDRGPDSAEVVERLAGGPPLAGLPTVNLMGNHDFMMLAAIATLEPGAVGLWMSNGGVPALRSWGVPPATPPRDWAQYIPRRHLVFLRDLAPLHRVGPYMFVHAGVRPGVALDRQSREDLMWIREPFLSHSGELGAVVVHGHTPRQEPEIRPHRIGVDTGAVLGGALTCAVLEGDRVGFLRA